jgi:hypothetical protein
MRGIGGEKMKEYIFSLVCVSLVATVFKILCPRDATSQKSVRFLISIVIISAIFLPSSRFGELLNTDYFASFEEMLGSYGEGTDNSDFSESFERYGAEYVNAEIKKDVCKSFNVSESNCRTVASFEMKEGALCLERISVILSGKAIWKDPHAIEEYVRNTYGCACNVAIE